MDKEKLTKLADMLSTRTEEPIIMSLYTLIKEMLDADDGNISWSDDNLGISIMCDTIDIVDIEAEESIGVFKFS